jgi:hypothetical protein
MLLMSIFCLAAVQIRLVLPILCTPLAPRQLYLWGVGGVGECQRQQKGHLVALRARGTAAGKGTGKVRGGGWRGAPDAC